MLNLRLNFDRDDEPRGLRVAGQRTASALAKNTTFAVLLLYVCHIAFFQVFGMGGAYGWGRNASAVVGVRLARVQTIPWGARFIKLDKGQKLRVVYDTTSGEGGISAYLSRKWPAGILLSETVRVQENGKGALDLVAPADGWYKVKVTSSEILTPEQRAKRNASPYGPRLSASLGFSVRWHAIQQ
jgi:hypothetical protein